MGEREKRLEGQKDRQIMIRFSTRGRKKGIGAFKVSGGPSATLTRRPPAGGSILYVRGQRLICNLTSNNF